MCHMFQVQREFFLCRDYFEVFVNVLKILIIKLKFMHFWNNLHFAVHARGRHL